MNLTPKSENRISFSPPDISELEIGYVCDALRSGWITTGPKTKELESKLAEYINTTKMACLNSATAALELALRVLGVALCLVNTGNFFLSIVFLPAGLASAYGLYGGNNEQYQYL